MFFNQTEAQRQTHRTIHPTSLNLQVLAGPLCLLRHLCSVNYGGTLYYYSPGRLHERQTEWHKPALFFVGFSGNKLYVVMSEPVPWALCQCLARGPMTGPSDRSHVPTRGTFPARNLCGCGLERGSAPRNSFDRLRTSSSGGGGFLSRS